MLERIRVDVQENVLLQTTDLRYGERSYWCGATFAPLKMSLIRPRCFFPYDKPQGKLPVLAFLCGGGWTEIDQNAWLPELVWYAKHGNVVASIEYSLSPTWTFPAPLQDVKLAIRYLRKNAQKLGIDPDRIALMGESAGAYFAAMAGVTGDMAEFAPEEYPEQSDNPNTVVTLYAPIHMADFEGRGDLASYDTHPQGLLRGGIEPQSILAGCPKLREDPALSRAMDPRSYVEANGNLPPFMMLHGTRDSQVPCCHSQAMYDALQAAGAKADLLLIEGAEHADHHFVQTFVKQRVLEFLNENMK